MVLLLVVEVEVELLLPIKMVVMEDQTMVTVEEVLLEEPLEGQEMGMEIMVVQDLQVAHQDMDLVLVVVLAGLVVLDLILGKQQLLEVLEHQIVF
jgi:hypothetical protein